ncbi:AbiV family abortive infection protein [Epilithonimonas mollis]|uniref:Abortive infection protein, AbiV family n=1 Tax=Epilithonimonas mollis TaxID=216903 RepID=A0A1M6PE92_9FLAO|nr:AbiV family abortive infection protein [Epilithonimonas mollis]SHK06210.1 abortive infection protein, AbiV family [Epilithonimonas mollis]
MEKEFLRGLELCIINSKNFFDDAKILDDNKRIRAYTFYQLCIEECGRFYLIYNCLDEYYAGKIKAKDLNFGRLKKSFESHTSKTHLNIQNLIINSLVFIEMSNFENKNEIEHLLLNNYNELINLKEELNSLKNDSLYVSFKNNKFILPDDKISLYKFQIIKNIARVSLKALLILKEFYESKGGFKNMKLKYVPD